MTTSAFLQGEMPYTSSSSSSSQPGGVGEEGLEQGLGGSLTSFGRVSLPQPTRRRQRRRGKKGEEAGGTGGEENASSEGESSKKKPSIKDLLGGKTPSEWLAPFLFNNKSFFASFDLRKSSCPAAAAGEEEEEEGGTDAYQSEGGAGKVDGDEEAIFSKIEMPLGYQIEEREEEEQAAGGGGGGSALLKKKGGSTHQQTKKKTPKVIRAYNSVVGNKPVWKPVIYSEKPIRLLPGYSPPPVDPELARQQSLAIEAENSKKTNYEKYLELKMRQQGGGPLPFQGRPFGGEEALGEGDLSTRSSLLLANHLNYPHHSLPLPSSSSSPATPLAPYGAPPYQPQLLQHSLHHPAPTQFNAPAYCQDLQLPSPASSSSSSAFSSSSLPLPYPSSSSQGGVVWRAKADDGLVHFNQSLSLSPSSSSYSSAASPSTSYHSYGAAQGALGSAVMTSADNGTEGGEMARQEDSPNAFNQNVLHAPPPNFASSSSPPAQVPSSSAPSLGAPQHARAPFSLANAGQQPHNSPAHTQDQAQPPPYYHYPPSSSSCFPPQASSYYGLDQPTDLLQQPPQPWSANNNNGACSPYDHSCPPFDGAGPGTAAEASAAGGTHATNLSSPSFQEARPQVPGFFSLSSYLPQPAPFSALTKPLQLRPFHPGLNYSPGVEVHYNYYSAEEFSRQLAARQTEKKKNSSLSLAHAPPNDQRQVEKNARPASSASALPCPPQTDAKERHYAGALGSPGGSLAKHTAGGEEEEEQGGGEEENGEDKTTLRALTDGLKPLFSSKYKIVTGQTYVN